MNTNELKKFAQYARRYLIDQVSAKLKLVLKSDSTARRENPKAVEDLEKQIQETSIDQVIEKVAYVWFNRFCALRFMDINRYTPLGLVSPVEDQFQPEILAEAKSGHIDEELVPEQTRKQVFGLLGGTSPAQDPQQEAYQLLLVAVCNYYNRSMPFLFQRITDYTELLMPDDLLSENSILANTREALTPESCKDVEVIGWLYQFYISEKKDQVFEGLKKNKKIIPENIPAATQLFTPHWIVRYLVENSLGRLWMLNRPNSKLIEQMEYYIKPGQKETDFLKISSPEEIKLCDPACGSGHMLTYSFDILYSIYEEEGYETSSIPKLILENNLYGIEIDERAGELAAFALTMKARSRYRRFFNKHVQPNICVLQNINFEEGELGPYMDAVGRDLFTINLQTTLHQFEEADNLGSLIKPTLTNLTEILSKLKKEKIADKVFLFNVHQKALLALKQADYLSPKYDVVITNPPYMGSKGMNGRLSAWAKDNYPDSKSDLFAMFMERTLGLTQKRGMMAMINMQSWMFLSSFEKLRTKLLSNATLLSMAHLGERGFDTIGGAVVSTTAFVFENALHPAQCGNYLRLVNGGSEAEKSTMALEAIQNPNNGFFFRASAMDFKKIPGCPVAYWVSDKVFDAFEDATLGDYAEIRGGMSTSNNVKFLRYWPEVSISKAALSISKEEATKFDYHWFVYNKGGELRKWFGNRDFLLNWRNGGADIKHAVVNNPRDPNTTHWSRRIFNTEYFFEEGVTWGDINTNIFSARLLPEGAISDSVGIGAYRIKDEVTKLAVLALLNSKVFSTFAGFLCPTLHFNSGPMSNVPIYDGFPGPAFQKLDIIRMIELARLNWDAYETSWNYTNQLLLHPDYRHLTLDDTFQELRAHWQDITLEMQRLEEENNRIFIEAYGLQEELTPDVPLSEITLTCNPHYRYGGDKSEEELEALLLADTMKEFISYGVGCMFGRYALDKPGLILANQGETIEEYFEQIPDSTFPADDDNVIPMLDGDWFTDDISERFLKFLRVTFGEEHYEENLKFIENALGKDIRKFFLRDFYNDHVKRYKKRPIYWLFSSPKGSFNALIYMHRYRPDTVSVVLNDYLREFRTKLTSRKSHVEQVSISASASQGEKTKALKETEKLKRIIEELEEYEREILYPLATQKVEIDLDDGVKVNYNKFGKALKKIPGLSGKK